MPFIVYPLVILVAFLVTLAEDRYNRNLHK